jgi:hypothetical protein
LGWTVEEDLVVEAYFYDDPSFPDTILEAVIRHQVGTDPGGPLTANDLQTLVSLGAPNRGIEDLTGLEQCINLEQLWLSNNNITDISPLSGLTQLTLLGLNYNVITDASPLSGLVNLETVSLAGNSISNVDPFEYLEELVYLDLSNNLIEYLGAALIGSDYGLVANDGLGSGDGIELSGNPLRAYALCHEIPILEDRGVGIIHDEECDTDPASDSDQDDDGLTNAEEMRYLR